MFHVLAAGHTRPNPLVLVLVIVRRLSRTLGTARHTISHDLRLGDSAARDEYE